jgi:hypothetical protein
MTILILPQLLLSFLVVWGITHAWQYGGEKNWPGFWRTELYFWLNFTRIIAIGASALVFFAVIWWAKDVYDAVLHAVFDTCSL